MMTARTAAQSTRRRTTAAGTVIPWPDARQRRQRRRRDGASRPAPGAGPGTLTHWCGPNGPHHAAGYDAMIRQTWRLHCAGVIGWEEAARRDVALRRQRYALGEGREASA